jgi:hypothetical protein
VHMSGPCDKGLKGVLAEVSYVSVKTYRDIQDMLR